MRLLHNPGKGCISWERVLVSLALRLSGDRAGRTWGKGREVSLEGRNARRGREMGGWDSSALELYV